jgi:hypothetical protein
MNPEHVSTAELIWERMCVESYIYHSAVTTLFDCQPDLVNDTFAVLEKFQGRMSPWPSTGNDRQESMSTVSSIQSPVLGAPYQMFLALMEGIRLVRTGSPSSQDTLMFAWSHYHNVSHMQCALDTGYTYYEDPRRWIGRLYATAIRLLFLYFISCGQNNCQEKSGLLLCYAEMQCTFDEARKLLIATEGEIDRTWGKFFLWPLAVIGAMVCNESDIALVRNWLDRVLKRGNSSGVIIIKEVLEQRVWQHSKNECLENAKSFYAPGLSIMLDTNIMNATAANLVRNVSDQPFSSTYETWPGDDVK